MEGLARGATAKFDMAAALFDRVGPPHTPLRIELEALRTRYALATGHLFLRASEVSRHYTRDEFLRTLASEGFLTELDQLVARLRRELESDNAAAGESAAEPASKHPASSRRRRRAALGSEDTAAARRELRQLFEQYAEHGTMVAAVPAAGGGAPRYNWCTDCRQEMVVSADTSELECPGCRRCHPLLGTIFDDSQYYNQEGQKAKSGSFNPNRHFRFWMDRILAREPEEELGEKDDPANTCGEHLLASLRTLVRRDRKILQLLTVDDVREMLKALGRTDLNKNVPLILKKLTGIGPPSLPEAICQRVEKLFSQAIEIGARIRPKGRTNRSYYPFTIYKLLDAILPENDYEHRRVLCYVYFQGELTLNKNDEEWREICAELGEITWTPTDPTKVTRYNRF